MIVEVQPKVSKIKLSAKEWQLYTASMACGKAATSLNKAFKDAVNKKGSTPESVEEAVNKVRAEYAKFGAYDTVPSYVMWDLIKMVYGRYPEGVF